MWNRVKLEMIVWPPRGRA